MLALQQGCQIKKGSKNQNFLFVFFSFFWMIMPYGCKSDTDNLSRNIKLDPKTKLLLTFGVWTSMVFVELQNKKYFSSHRK